MSPLSTPASTFVGCATPPEWLALATQCQDLLLIDHAHCEKKAAGSAMSLIYRYVDRPRLLRDMARLAREELRHFEQVSRIMERRGIRYRHLSPSRYAAGLREEVATAEPRRLLDTLVCGAFIEARSCERFEALAVALAAAGQGDQELPDFFFSLVASEQSHYARYLTLAQELIDESSNALSTAVLEEAIARIRARDVALITTADDAFRFHSGVPSTRAREAAEQSELSGA